MSFPYLDTRDSKFKPPGKDTVQLYNNIANCICFVIATYAPYGFFREDEMISLYSLKSLFDTTNIPKCFPKGKRPPTWC